MDYSVACEILCLTSPKSLKENAKLAESILNNLTREAPLRYKVACKVLINAAK